jgi:hypothetical protein
MSFSSAPTEVLMPTGRVARTAFPGIKKSGCPGQGSHFSVFDLCKVSYAVKSEGSDHAISHFRKEDHHQREAVYLQRQRADLRGRHQGIFQIATL